MLPCYELLETLPTLGESQACNLKIDTGDFRVWISRCGLADGEPFENTVYVEFNDGDRWKDLGHYDGDNPPRGLPGFTPHALRGEL